jgi:hypothetical protein
MNTKAEFAMATVNRGDATGDFGRDVSDSSLILAPHAKFERI